MVKTSHRCRSIPGWLTGLRPVRHPDVSGVNISSLFRRVKKRRPQDAAFVRSPWADLNRHLHASAALPVELHGSARVRQDSNLLFTPSACRAPASALRFYPIVSGRMGFEPTPSRKNPGRSFSNELLARYLTLIYIILSSWLWSKSHAAHQKTGSCQNPGVI